MIKRRDGGGRCEIGGVAASWEQGALAKRKIAHDLQFHTPKISGLTTPVSLDWGCHVLTQLNLRSGVLLWFWQDFTEDFIGQSTYNCIKRTALFLIYFCILIIWQSLWVSNYGDKVCFLGGRNCLRSIEDAEHVDGDRKYMVRYENARLKLHLFEINK